jgi:hypothetical protein
VHLTGSGFYGGESVKLTFSDSLNGTATLTTVTTDGSGSFSAQVTVPANATSGTQSFKATGQTSGITATRSFTVT